MYDRKWVQKGRVLGGVGGTGIRTDSPNSGGVRVFRCMEAVCLKWYRNYSHGTEIIRSGTEHSDSRNVGTRSQGCVLVVVGQYRDQRSRGEEESQGACACSTEIHVKDLEEI
jgi:hypothetical protein